ncbi:MAG: hypothetical protein DRN40_07530 [Thermoplasmata archaeon]|nr:MAG: hypothetical protein DRN40_07530 [Thermoplasmata archaeon]
MLKVDLHTSVDDIIECEDVPGFLIKKVTFGRDQFWTPLRTIYLSTLIPQRIRREITDFDDKSLYEFNKIVYLSRVYDAINNALEEGDDDRIKRFLKINDEIGGRRISVSLSFSEFPHRRLGDNYYELLNYVYPYSKLLFVPHVRFGDTKTKTSYDSRAFIRHVERSINILKERNTKPIFVPLDVDFDRKTRDQVLAYYARNGLTNIWVDCKGHMFSKIMVAKMRNLRRMIDRLFATNARDVIVYLTNMRKTPRQSPSDSRFVPSDFIGAFSYADVVGPPWKGIVAYQESEEEPYWVRKGYPTKLDYDMAIFRRDCSIFENSSYYYYPPDRIRIGNFGLDTIRKRMLEYGPTKKNIAERIGYSVNGLLTLSELQQLRKRVKRDAELLSYIEEKEFFRKEGIKILEELKTSRMKGSERRLFDFMRDQ